MVVAKNSSSASPQIGQNQPLKYGTSLIKYDVTERKLQGGIYMKSIVQINWTVKYSHLHIE